jgi:hypothetical protein
MLRHDNILGFIAADNKGEWFVCVWQIEYILEIRTSFLVHEE